MCRMPRKISRKTLGAARAVGEGESLHEELGSVNHWMWFPGFHGSAGILRVRSVCGRTCYGLVATKPQLKGPEETIIPLAIPNPQTFEWNVPPRQAHHLESPRRHRSRRRPRTAPRLQERRQAAARRRHPRRADDVDQGRAELRPAQRPALLRRAWLRRPLSRTIAARPATATSSSPT